MTAAGSPSCFAAASNSYVTFFGAPSACSTRIRTSAMTTPLNNLLGGQELGERYAAAALIGHDLALLLRQARREIDHLAGRPGQADAAGIEAEIGDRQCLYGLFLRRHNPLERGISGLVDLLDHADDDRQARLDGLISGVDLALDPGGRALDRDRPGAGQRRDAEPLPQHRTERTDPGVGGFGADHHDVEFECFEG